MLSGKTTLFKKRRKKRREIKKFIVVAVICALCAYILTTTISNIEKQIKQLNNINVRIEVPYNKIENGKITRHGILKGIINPVKKTIIGKTEENYNIYNDRGKREVFGSEKDGITIKIKE